VGTRAAWLSWSAVVTATSADQVRELEQALEEYPEERGEILLELADAYASAGERERAVEVWRDLIADGGEDGDFARYALAEELFKQGENEAARAELATLKAGGRVTHGAWHLAAELYETRGELAEAADWFTTAVRQLSDEDLTRLREDGLSWMSRVGMLIRARRRVREAMGQPPDHLDRAVPSQQEIERQFCRLGDALGGADVGSSRSPASRSKGPRSAAAGAAERTVELLSMYWTRADFPEAHRRWPELVTAEEEAEYFARVEQLSRDHAEAGTRQITMVPCDVAGYAEFAERTGADPTALPTRRDYLELLAAQGRTISWPPPRNSPCWCGSTRKYKKCCGRPMPAPHPDGGSSTSSSVVMASSVDSSFSPMPML
jgi:tetratricopeptide (TPR) repeat protein